MQPSGFCSGCLSVPSTVLTAVDLQIDAKKTYAWSLTGVGRKALRSKGSNVLLSARNLGAHVQMSKTHTNSTLIERAQGMQSLWQRLRVSACRYATKIRALVVAAWPRALHAIASTTLSDAAFHSLRAGAVKGLDADRVVMRGSSCASLSLPR